jgi:hypothetical protein
VNSKLLDPVHPERICWGCERYCAAHDLACGNGTIRTPHPCELFGKDWQDWARGEKPAEHTRDASEHK